MAQATMTMLQPGKIREFDVGFWLVLAAGMRIKAQRNKGSKCTLL